MTLYKWSQTASADATADSSINWAEGQAPSSVNDSARAMMAATAKYRDDIAGAIVTTGTGTSYTISSYQGFDTLAHLNGQMIALRLTLPTASRARQASCSMWICWDPNRCGRHPELNASPEPSSKAHLMLPSAATATLFSICRVFTAIHITCRSVREWIIGFRRRRTAHSCFPLGRQFRGRYMRRCFRLWVQLLERATVQRRSTCQTSGGVFRQPLIQLELSSRHFL